MSKAQKIRAASATRARRPSSPTSLNLWPGGMCVNMSRTTRLETSRRRALLEDLRISLFGILRSRKGEGWAVLQERSTIGFSVCGEAFPSLYRPGTLPPGQASPRVDLNLQPGELVRIKSFDEIRATFDKSSMNRGLLFGPELVPFCGKTYRVQASVERFIDEKTGYFISLKTPAVILENVWCEARYSNCRMFCPRNIYAWWREIWLERVSESGDEKKA